MQSTNLINRGRDICALWDAIVPGIPNPGLTQCIRWAKQYSDSDIEGALARTYRKFRYTSPEAEAAHRYTTGTLVFTEQLKEKVAC
jgi:hypothetical protein